MKSDEPLDCMLKVDGEPLDIAAAWVHFQRRPWGQRRYWLQMRGVGVKDAFPWVQEGDHEITGNEAADRFKLILQVELSRLPHSATARVRVVLNNVERVRRYDNIIELEGVCSDWVESGQRPE